MLGFLKFSVWDVSQFSGSPFVDDFSGARALASVWSGPSHRPLTIVPTLVPAKDSLNHIHLTALDEADDFHLAAAKGTPQRINFIHS